MKEALYWIEKDKAKGSVLCGLCPHGCVIYPDKYGICGVRKNTGGKLFSTSYDQVTALNLDPIEKKPLYHFYPGTKILSAGSFGCNFKCSFCQNWEISQSGLGEVPSRVVEPEKIVAMALENASIGIAYTYNEPLMNYEWVKDVSRLAKAAGLVNVLVTNGYVNPEPLSELLPLIDAANVDIKSFTEGFYNKLCKAKLAPVLETVATMEKKGVHVEITTLLIPGENDSQEEIEKLTGWIAELNPEMPLHFSRYFPTYKMETDATAAGTLEMAWKTAKKKLKHVYVGNIDLPHYSKTFCPSCENVLIERNGYDVKTPGIKDGKCVKCSRTIKLK